MRVPAAQTLTICSGAACRPRVKAPRRALPSMLTTPLTPKLLLNLRKTASRPFGSSARKTLLNVSWLGMPCLSSRNRRNSSSRPLPKNSTSVQVLAPANVAAKAMTRISTRSCRVLLARGSLSGRNKRLSLRILVSLGNRETPKESSSNRLATALQRHMRFPYPGGGGSPAQWAGWGEGLSSPPVFQRLKFSPTQSLQPDLNSCISLADGSPHPGRLRRPTLPLQGRVSQDRQPVPSPRHRAFDVAGHAGPAHLGPHGINGARGSHAD